MPGTITADIHISSPCTNVLHSPPVPDASLSDSTLIFSSSRAELIEAALSEEDVRFFVFSWLSRLKRLQILYGKDCGR